MKKQRKRIEFFETFIEEEFNFEISEQDDLLIYCGDNGCTDHCIIRKECDDVFKTDPPHFKGKDLEIIKAKFSEFFI